MNTPFNRSKLSGIILLCIFYSLLNGKINAQNEDDFELVSIEFRGNTIFSQAELEKVILSKESPGWFLQFLDSFTSFGSEALYYNPILIDSDINRLKSFYRDRGYFKNKISFNVEVDSSDNDTELIFNIDAGEPSHIKSYNITGLDNIYPDFIEMIEGRVTIEIGEQYSASTVNDTRAIILNFLGDRGYMTVTSAPPEILADTLKNEVEIKMDFKPGTRFTISEIRVERTGEGRDEVDDQLLHDLVDINEGDYYSNEKIQLSQVRLYRTNLFNSALIMGNRQDTVNQTVPLEILTNIGKIYQITPEIIFNDENSEFNLGLALEFTKRNFLGGARKLSTTFSVASTDPYTFVSGSDSLYGYLDARLTLEQPILFGSPINTTLESYYTNRRRNSDFDAILYGGKISLNFDLPRFTYVTSLSTYFNFEHERNAYKEDFIYKSFFNFLYNESKDSTEVSNQVMKYIKSSDFDLISRSNNTLIGVNIGMNNTNDQQLMFPTRGVNFHLLLEGGNSINFILRKIMNYKGNEPEYYKIQFVSSLYFPLFDLERSAFAFKLKTGIIQTYKGNKFNIPLNQRFYSGGSNSVRGWRARKLNTREDVNLELSDINNLTSGDFELIYNQNIDPGGFFMLEASAEARIHIFGDFGSAIFLDAGNNWDDPNDFEFNEVALSAGIGLRYYSPFAPIRVDLGVKLWDPRRRMKVHEFPHFFDDAVRLQIGIGEAF